jgi:hypothetical protein
MELMPEVLGRCPVCSEDLRVARLECAACGTAIEGSFSLNRFHRLTPEQLAFLGVFVKNRGVIRDVERELSISYPTVRGRLDDLIRALGYEVRDDGAAAAAAEEAERRRQLLERLSRGELTADQALKALKRQG